MMMRRRMLLAALLGSGGLISFTIMSKTSSLGTFQAEKGMTWAEWCDSEHNTDYWRVKSSKIYHPYGGYYIATATNGNYISSTAIIEDGVTYYTKT